MKGSLVVVAFFCAGCMIGAVNNFQYDMHSVSMYVLYALMLQVGISIGSNKKLKELIKSLRLKMLLVPIATITGTLLFSALASLLLSQWSVFDCMAVGSGLCLLFTILHSDHTVQRTVYRITTGHRIGNHCITGQYFPGNDGLTRRSAHTEILWTAGPYLGCRSELDGCIAAIHHTLFGKRHDSLSHIPRNTD